ncbi:MAG: imidazolonepropionase [Thermoplasmatota archaeon]
MKQDDLIFRNIGKLISFPGIGPVPGTKMDSPEVIENAAVSVCEGIISVFGPENDVWEKANIAEDAGCIDCKGRCVVPGFVDPHTHAVFGGTREFELPMKLRGASYLDILEAGGGILRTVQDTRALSVEELTDQLDGRLDKMVRYGTTTVEIKSGYGLDRDTEIRLLEAVKASKHPMEKVSTFLGPHAIPPEFKNEPEKFLDMMIGMLPEIAERNLAEYADIFCEKGVFTSEQSRKFLIAAREAGLKVKIHSDEIENLGGTLVGAELKAASADHLLVSNEVDLKAMKESGTVPVMLPGTLMTIFENRVPRVRNMIDMDLPLAIATDINPNCLVENMQYIQSLACYRLRMTPNEVLAASTANSAHAIGLSHRKGRIAPGFDADILILKDESFEHVVYNFGVNHVDSVFIKGKRILSDIGW